MIQVAASGQSGDRREDALPEERRQPQHERRASADLRPRQSLEREPRPQPSAEPAAASITATVSLDAIAHNVRLLRERAGGALLMTVVKANGYGHGAAEIARVALDAGASEIGVATIDEALELRAAGVTAPILAWLHSGAAQFRAAIAADVALGISSLEQARAIRALARETGGASASGTPGTAGVSVGPGSPGTTCTTGASIRVDIKLDTGLARGGVAASEWAAVMDELALAERESGLRVRGVFSHLACADEPDHPSIDAQAARFREGIALARERGLTPSINHLANSAATLTRPDLAFDMVRAGIATYGLSPVPALGSLGLRAALGLTAQLASVKRVDAGAGVSYGHRWTSERETTLGLVTMGYADGLPRALSGRFSVRAGGRNYPAVGRICMDQFVVDLGTNPVSLRAGDEVTLIGAEPGEATLQDWADTLDTISYELATLLRGRTRLRYLG